MRKKKQHFTERKITRRGFQDFDGFQPRIIRIIRTAEYQSGPNSTPNIPKQLESAYH